MCTVLREDIGLNCRAAGCRGQDHVVCRVRHDGKLFALQVGVCCILIRFAGERAGDVGLSVLFVGGHIDVARLQPVAAEPGRDHLGGNDVVLVARFGEGHRFADVLRGQNGVAVHRLLCAARRQKHAVQLMVRSAAVPLYEIDAPSKNAVLSKIVTATLPRVSVPVVKRPVERSTKGMSWFMA